MTDISLDAAYPYSTAEPLGRADLEIGTWEWDRRSGRVAWSPSLERIHGRKPGTFPGTFDAFTSDIHPDDRDAVVSRIEAAAADSSTAYSTEYRIVLPGTGQVRWVETYGEPVLDSEGEVTGLRGVCIDVSGSKNRARYRDAVYALSRALAEANDLQEGLGLLVHVVGTTFDCAYTEYRDATADGMLRARAAWAPPELEMLSRGLVVDVDPRFDGGIASRAWTSRQPIWVRDLGNDAPSLRRDRAIAGGLSSAFACPVTSGSDVIGILVGFLRVPLPEDGLEATLIAITAEVSQFVRRLTAEQALQHRERQQAAAAHLGRLALTDCGRQAFLDEAMQLLSETLDVELVKVLQLLPGGEELRLVSGTGWADGLVGVARVTTDSASQAGYTLWNDGPVVVRSLHAEDRFSGPELLRQHGVVSGMSTVIRLPDGLWGVLGVHTATERTFSGDDTVFLETMANILASALDRDERERGQEFLLDATEVLFDSLDYEETLRELARLAISQIADWCVVYLLDPNGERHAVEAAHRDPVRTQHLRDYLSSGEPVLPQDNLIDRAIETGRAGRVTGLTPEILQDRVAETRLLALLSELGTASVIVAPLPSRERTLGAMLLVSGESGQRYGATQQALAAELGRRAGIAIDHAHLYEQTRDSLQTREDFVSIASHELRSPLTSIRGYAQRARRRELPAEELVASLEVIASEADRMQEMLSLFLELAGLDLGRFAPDTAETDVVALIREELEVVRQQPDVMLAAHLPDDPQTVVTDDTRLRTIVSNLLSNAIKYGGAPPEITVTVDPGPEAVAIRVRDNGDGIPPEVGARIFDRFYRSNETRVRGLGLGLYISRQVAERLGAELSYQTEPGRGTEFTLLVPREYPGA